MAKSQNADNSDHRGELMESGEQLQDLIGTNYDFHSDIDGSS